MKEESLKNQILIGIYKSRYYTRAINKITLDLGLSIKEDKEDVRKVLQGLEEEGMVEGVPGRGLKDKNKSIKWRITKKGKNFVKQINYENKRIK